MFKIYYYYFKIMFETLFIVIFIGAIIMSCLFFYWLKYVYVEKDDKEIRSRYSLLSQNINEKNNNNQTLYEVDPEFIKKAKNKKA